MHLSFSITHVDLPSFVRHWAEKYPENNERRYDDNIDQPLSGRSLQELFEWKNGGVISKKKLLSIARNYPIKFEGDRIARYLNHKQSGGAIWNIFYLHCLDPKAWPIFDQHTFRAMTYLKRGEICEIGVNSRLKYEAYRFEYIPFLENFKGLTPKLVDRALFAFGKFLKIAKRFK